MVSSATSRGKRKIPEKKPNPSKGLSERLIALAGLVAIVGVVVAVLLALDLLGNQGGGDGIANAALLDTPRVAGRPDLEAGPEVGKLAPDFEISDYAGERHRLSDFRGKAVYVNIWATWCGPCQVELPDMADLQGRFKNNLAIITVNRREPVDRARSFFEELARNDGGTGVSFAVNGMDPDDTLYGEYRGLGMPVSFFISPDGVITRVYNGLIRLDAMEQAVTEALAAS